MEVTIFEVGSRYNSYSNDLKCQHSVVCDAGKELRWKFENRFGIEPHSSCIYDYLDLQLEGISIDSSLSFIQLFKGIPNVFVEISKTLTLS